MEQVRGAVLFEDASQDECRRAGLVYARSLCELTQAPLVLMLHGRAGDRSSMRIFRRVLPAQSNIIFAQGPYPDPKGGFGWWRGSAFGPNPHDWRQQGRSSAQDLTQALIRIEEQYGLRPAIRLGFGFSQGAAVLSLIIQLDPGFLHGAALLSGFVLEAETPLNVSQYTRVLVAHGSSDQKIPLALSREGVEKLRAKGYSVVYLEHDNGHKMPTSAMQDLERWVNGVLTVDRHLRGSPAAITPPRSSTSE